MSADRRPNLILGVVEDLEWVDIRPFVRSLRQTTFDGELRLFVSGLTGDTAKRLEREGARLHRFRRARLERAGRVFHPYDPPLRRFRSSRITPAYPTVVRVLTLPARDRTSARARLAAFLSIPHVARFFRYFTYLSRAEAYGNIMLTDVRDVFFQHDPFDFDIGDRLHVFLEHEQQTLGSQKHNRGWLLEAFGDQVLRELEAEPISCSGVTIGSHRAILGYLQGMVESLLELPRQHGGIDQAVHNYVVHKGLVPDLELVKHGKGSVLNLAIVPKTEVNSMLPGGYPDVNVLHQYDRHPALAASLLRRLDDRGH